MFQLSRLIAWGSVGWCGDGWCVVVSGWLGRSGVGWEGSDYIVNDPGENFSAYYNVSIKHKHHQSRLPVSAWHYAKNWL